MQNTVPLVLVKGSDFLLFLSRGQTFYYLYCESKHVQWICTYLTNGTSLVEGLELGLQNITCSSRDTICSRLPKA